MEIGPNQERGWKNRQMPSHYCDRTEYQIIRRHSCCTSYKTRSSSLLPSRATPKPRPETHLIYRTTTMSGLLHKAEDALHHHKHQDTSKSNEQRAHEHEHGAGSSIPSLTDGHPANRFQTTATVTTTRKTSAATTPTERVKTVPTSLRIGSMTMLPRLSAERVSTLRALGCRVRGVYKDESMTYDCNC